MAAATVGPQWDKTEATVQVFRKLGAPDNQMVQVFRKQTEVMVQVFRKLGARDNKMVQVFRKLGAPNNNDNKQGWQ